MALFTLNKLPAEKVPEPAEILAEHVRKVNEHLASFETIKNFLILPEDFTVENGLLTPTFKIKRKAVEDKYQQEIADLYLRTKKPG